MFGPWETLKRLHAQFQPDGTPAGQCVACVFHTYYGFFVFAIQTEHRFSLPPERARDFLWRLHKFNLSWGFTAYGALLIPVLSFFNYFAQKRSIRKQEERLGQVNPERIRQSRSLRSMFYSVLGWTCAGLCALFAIAIVVGLATRPFDAVKLLEVAIGGITLIALLGWAARDWIREGRLTPVVIGRLGDHEPLSCAAEESMRTSGSGSNDLSRSEDVAIEDTVIDVAYQVEKAAELARERACNYRCWDCGQEFSIQLTGMEEHGSLDKHHGETCPVCGQVIGKGRVKCRRCQGDFILALPHWHDCCDFAEGNCPQCGERYSSWCIC